MTFRFNKGAIFKASAPEASFADDDDMEELQTKCVPIPRGQMVIIHNEYSNIWLHLGPSLNLWAYAERQGFEPWEGVTPQRFQDRRFQPLSHLSHTHLGRIYDIMILSQISLSNQSVSQKH